MRRSVAQIKFLSLAAVAMLTLSISAFADAPKNDTCAPNANQIDFNVAGMKDFSVGRDLLNNGGGWYLNAQAGEIIVPNSKGQLCEQKGTRPTAGNASDRENTPDVQKCGSAIDGTRQVQIPNGTAKPDVKDYQWKWVKNEKDDGGYLLITPLNSDGSPGSPYLKVNGNMPDAETEGPDKGKKKPTLSVTVTSVPGKDAPGQTSKKKDFDFGDSAAGSGGSTAVVCTLGSVTPDDKNMAWTKDKGLTYADGGKNDGNTVTPDTSATAKR